MWENQPTYLDTVIRKASRGGEQTRIKYIKKYVLEIIITATIFNKHGEQGEPKDRMKIAEYF